MSKPNIKCRVCGKEYYCCNDNKKLGGYKSVACSPECFKEYMKRVEEARNPKTEVIIDEVKGATKPKQKKNVTTDNEN